MIKKIKNLKYSKLDIPKLADYDRIKDLLKNYGFNFSILKFLSNVKYLL